MNRNTRKNPSPRQTGQYLDVEHGHRLWWQELGPAEGEPWLVLHGGPGSASHLSLAAPFNLQRQRVVLYDQRGCGHSRPAGGIRHNRLSDLVKDIETLRRHLGVERWSVLGGSWGATLALAYADAYPAAVERLVLRSAFDASDQVVRRLFLRHWNGLPGTGFSKLQGWQVGRPLFHRLSQLFRNGTPDATVRQVLQQWSIMETRAALRGVQRSVRALQAGAAIHLSELRAQRALSALMRRQIRSADSTGLPRRDEPALLAKFTVQAHFLKHGSFLGPTAWQQQLRRIAQAGIPCYWVHGTLDTVCPMSTAQQAHAHLQSRQPGLSTLNTVTAGHLGIEAPLAHALRAAVRPRPGNRFVGSVLTSSSPA